MGTLQNLLKSKQKDDSVPTQLTDENSETVTDDVNVTGFLVGVPISVEQRSLPRLSVLSEAGRSSGNT